MKNVTNTQLSVIILNYNVRYFLEQCLLSVQSALQTIDGEIIVVDNASKDDSCEMVKRLFPHVTLIENQENLGFPKGNNIGVAHAKGKYLCILNPDTVVAEDTFTKLLEFVRTQENLGVVGCKLIDGTGNFLPESKRNLPTRRVSLLKMIGISKWYYANHLSENQTGKISVFVGAFMFLERERYLEINGFDEDFFMYGEDVDLSYRLEKKDYENYYFPETTIIHYKGESTRKDRIYLARFYGSMKIFYKKHFKTNLLFDFITNVGIELFTFLNRFTKNKTKKIVPADHIFISENERFKTILAQKLSKKIHRFPTYKNRKFISLIKQKTEIIFDNSSISNKEIIDFIQKYKNQNFTFKINPKNTNFIIGSNSKIDRGEVVILRENATLDYQEIA